MTKREAAIVSAYTGVLLGDFDEMRRYINQIMGRSVYTHEMADGRVMQEIKRKAKNDFIDLEVK